MNRTATYAGANPGEPFKPSPNKKNAKNEDFWKNARFRPY
jgi:hypothetical protein